jgi:D-glycero-alpha-D-manno-heptose-7-phosphate kinase
MGGGASSTITRRSAVRRTLTARAPTRLDLGGGWTDVPPYADDCGAAVCNVAITRYATATASLDDDARSSHAPARGTDDALARAAIRCSSLPHASARVVSDFPVGAGLGGSSAAGVALAGALAALADVPLDAAALAERSRRTEVEELGVAGGFQDHYAAAFGGALLLTSDSPVRVERIALSDDCAIALARRIVLLYTGQSRISARTIAAVADACRLGDARVCRALDECKRLARLMADALRRADTDALGELVGEHWTHQRALHPSITTERIDAIHAACARAGALGMKALGASGGGCVMAVARDGHEGALATALAPLGERLAFAVDLEGFHVLPQADTSNDERS